MFGRISPPAPDPGTRQHCSETLRTVRYPLFFPHEPTTHPVICITWRQYLYRSLQLPHISCRDGGVPFIIPDIQTFGPANAPTLLFTKACRLFALFCELSSFVFS